VAEIDALDEAESKNILAEVFRFMYQREDGAWGRDKEIPGTELVSLLCTEMPEMGSHENAPDPVDGLVKRLEGAGVPDTALDDLVHEVASGIGSGANNEGFDGQVRFVVEEMGSEAGAREIENILRECTRPKQRSPQ
jgi:hypothetical protein